MLTNATVKAAAAAARPFKLADAGGLYLLVRPSGSKTWRMKYRFGRKEKLLWSDFGAGYGYFPLALPILGLLWLRTAGR